MTLRLCFMLFIVPFALSASVNYTVDQSTLQNVFGAPGMAPTETETAESDYDETYDQYTPASGDYDAFDWTLTKRIASSSNENFLISPLGLKLALAILTEAATGQTRTELASVLGLDLEIKAVRSKFSTIIDSLQTSSSQYILNLGSRIYVEYSAEPRQRFAAIAEQFYRTEMRKINFTNPTEAASDINGWVSNITEGRIKNLVDDDDVAGMVVLILNTLFFKGTWRHQFPPNATKPDTFYVTPENLTQIPLMHVKDRFYYFESSKYDAKILRMSYLGYKFAMYVIVPNTLTGVSRIFNNLAEIRHEMQNLREVEVDVTLPLFKFEYTSLLDGVLRELGVRKAFEETASFPGIARGEALQQRLRVSKVLQRSGIEVNELGSVAYSATEISLVNKFGEDREDVTPEVIANRPFLFFIQDESTKQLLFTGRVSNPGLNDGAFKF